MPQTQEVLGFDNTLINQSDSDFKECITEWRIQTINITIYK